MKHKIRGGVFAIVGFILSPVSWWNDLLVNIPLAYIFALPFGFFSQKLFFPAMILGYWITNVVGFMMMHHGVKDVFSSKIGKYTRKELFRDVLMSLAYTSVVVVIIMMGWLKFPTEYFK